MSEVTTRIRHKEHATMKQQVGEGTNGKIFNLHATIIYAINTICLNCIKRALLDPDLFQTSS